MRSNILTMNDESIERLGAIPTPAIFANAQGSALGSTVSMNTYGDLLLLGQDGNVYFQNIRQANRSLENDNETDSGPFTLPVRGITAAELQNSFPHVLSNSEGTILALWSKTAVGIIEIPSSFTKDGLLIAPSDSTPEVVEEGGYCRFVSLLSPSGGDRPSSAIMKVDFHPLNPNCLVVLCEREALYVIDLRIYEKEKITLPKQFAFTSFCFAKSASEWFRFTIFLTTTQNEIYYLCPIIPNGTIVSKSYLVELLSWTVTHKDEIEQQLLGHSATGVTASAARERRMEAQEQQLKYFQYCLQYLRSKFGKEVIQQVLEQLEENPHYYDDVLDVQQQHEISANNELGTGRNLLDVYLVAENHSLFVPNMTTTQTSLWNDLSDEKELEDLEFSHIQVALQGPILIQRSAKQQEGVRGVAGVMIHDLCTPTIPSQYQGMMAPIIVTVQSTGLVEVLLFDIMDETLWLLSPAWKSLSATFDYLPVPNLVVADTFQVISSSLGEVPSSLDYYELQADPVFSHYFYCINKRQGEVYLLISNWLESAMTAMVQVMDQIDQEQREHLLQEEEATSGGRISGGVEEEKELSYSPRSLGEGLPITTSSSSAHPVSECYPLYQNESAPEEHRGINGLAVVKDPFLGHLLLIHSDLQTFVLVNITSHVKLCQLQSQFQEEQLLPSAGTSKEISIFQEQLEGLTTAESLRSRKSQQLLLQIAEGLQTVPKLEMFVTKDQKEIPKSEVQTKKELIETAQLLEKKVITPLRSLLQNLGYHLELIEALAQVQQELVEGNRATPAGEGIGADDVKDLVLVRNFTTLSPSQQKELLLRQGIQGLLRLLAQVNEEFVERIAALQQKNQSIKQRIDHYLLLLFKSRHSLTVGERLYHQQLEAWLQMIPKLTREIEIVKQFYIKQKLATTTTAPTKTSAPPALTMTSFAGEKKKGPGLFGSGFAKPSIGLPFQTLSQPNPKPSFFQQRGIQPLPVIGSPSTATTTTMTPTATTNTTKEGGVVEAIPKTTLSFGKDSSATGALHFTTTLGSSLMFSSANKATASTDRGNNMFGTPTATSTSKTMKPVSSLDTPIKSDGEKDLKVTGSDDSILFSAMKNTMSLHELSDPHQHHSQTHPETTTAPGLQLQLSEEDQALCLDLLKAQEEMIQQNRVKVLALEKKLRLLRRLQHQTPPSSY